MGNTRPFGDPTTDEFCDPVEHQGSPPGPASGTARKQ